MLARSYRLRSGDEIRDVIKRGQRYSTPFFTLHFIPSDTPKFAVITGKVLGGAVQRNKIKRRTTDAIWQSFSAIGSPIHGVFRMRAIALTGSFEELLAATAEALAKAGK